MKHDKRPSFQFYPGDWMSDLKLRRCSPAARGVWVDVLCALHDSDDGYGFVRWPLKELARTIGAAMPQIKELVDKGVLRGNDSEVRDACIYVPRSGRRDGAPVTLIATQPGPLWYSKRLVKDEYVRTTRGEGTRFGEGSGEAPKPKPKPSPTRWEGDGSPSPSPSPTSFNSEAIASAAAEPSAPLTAKDRVWLLGVGLLGEKGRGLLGKLVSTYGDEVLAGVLADATQEKPLEPKAWITAACEARKVATGNGKREPDLFADPKPEWALKAGFPDRFQAENAGCLAHNSHKFRGGVRVQEAA